MIRGKKALLFTVLVLFILSTLLTVTIAFTKRSEDIGRRMGTGLMSYKVQRMSADVALDYFTILGIDIQNFSLQNNESRFEFMVNISDQISSRNTLLSDYISFVEDNYSARVNINTSLDLNDTFRHGGFSESYTVGEETFKGDLSSELHYVSLSVKLNDSDSFLETDIFSTSVGTTELFIEVFDRNDNLIRTETGFIDITQNNNLFIEFNSTVPYSFFEFNISAGDFIAKVDNNLDAEMRIEFRHNATGKSKIYLNAGSNTILDPYLDSFKKEGSLNLISG